MNEATANTDNALQSDEVKALDTRSQELAESYDDYTVSSPEEYSAGADHLRTIKTFQKEVEDQRKLITQPLVAAQRNANAFFKPFAERLANAERRVKRALVNWKNKQDQIARDEQRKRDEEARKKREEAERKAREAREKGRHSRAQQLEETAAQTVAPIVTSEAPKTEGISVRKVTKFRITDESLIPRKYMDVNESKIRKVVQALGMEAEIPGIEIFQENEMAARSR